MAQTTKRSTFWSVTAFNAEIELLKGPKFPDWVKRVYGGEEKCPTSGTIHFQGCVQCTSQQRFSMFKSWLPTAHLEPARKKWALQKYAMKKETAIGEKLVRENVQAHMSAQDICMLLARQTDNTQVASLDVDYYKRVRMILCEQPHLAGQLMNPSLRNFFEKTHTTWLYLSNLEKLEDDEDSPESNVIDIQ